MDVHVDTYSQPCPRTTGCESGQAHVMEVLQGSGVCAALCIRRTPCRHVTIRTPIVIFCCLTVFWLFWVFFDEWYTVPIAKNTQNHWCTNRHRSTKTVPMVYQRCTNRQKQSKTAQKWPWVYQLSHVYQDCINSVTIVYQSSTRT